MFLCLLFFPAVAEAGYVLPSSFGGAAQTCVGSTYAPANNRLKTCLPCQSGLALPDSWPASAPHAIKMDVCREYPSSNLQEPHTCTCITSSKCACCQCTVLVSLLACACLAAAAVMLLSACPFCSADVGLGTVACCQHLCPVGLNPVPLLLCLSFCRGASRQVLGVERCARLPQGFVPPRVRED